MAGFIEILSAIIFAKIVMVSWLMSLGCCALQVSGHLIIVDGSLDIISQHAQLRLHW